MLPPTDLHFVNMARTDALEVCPPAHSRFATVVKGTAVQCAVRRQRACLCWSGRLEGSAEIGSALEARWRERGASRGLLHMFWRSLPDASSKNRLAHTIASRAALEKNERSCVRKEAGGKPVSQRSLKVSAGQPDRSDRCLPRHSWGLAPQLFRQF